MGAGSARQLIETSSGSSVATVADLQEFFAMGGHGLYVWLSYGLSAMVLLGLVWQVRAASKRFRHLARARQQRQTQSTSE